MKPTKKDRATLKEAVDHFDTLADAANYRASIYIAGSDSRREWNKYKNKHRRYARTLERLLINEL